MSSLDPLAPEPDGDTPTTFPVPAPAPRPPHPNFWWGSLWCLGFVLFMNGSIIAVAALAIGGRALLSPDPKAFLGNLGAGGKPGPELSDVLAFAVLTGEAASIVLGLVVVRVVVGPDWRRRLAVRLPSAAQLLLVLAGLPAFILLPGFVHELVGRFLPSLGINQGNAELFGSWPLWVGVVAVGLGPGIGEELWCRGFLGRGFVGHYGWLVGVLLTSLWFGMSTSTRP